MSPSTVTFPTPDCRKDSPGPTGQAIPRRPTVASRRRGTRRTEFADCASITARLRTAGSTKQKLQIGVWARRSATESVGANGPILAIALQKGETRGAAFRKSVSVGPSGPNELNSWRPDLGSNFVPQFARIALLSCPEGRVLWTFCGTVLARCFIHCRHPIEPAVVTRCTVPSSGLSPSTGPQRLRTQRRHRWLAFID